MAVKEAVAQRAASMRPAARSLLAARPQSAEKDGPAHGLISLLYS
jgi:hypothetical protein